MTTEIKKIFRCLCNGNLNKNGVCSYIRPDRLCGYKGIIPCCSKVEMTAPSAFPNWNNMQHFTLVKVTNIDEGYDELEVLIEGYKLMAILTNSIDSGENPGQTLWEYYIASINENGKLIDSDYNELIYQYSDVAFWMDLPSPPYPISN